MLLTLLVIPVCGEGAVYGVEKSGADNMLLTLLVIPKSVKEVQSLE